MDLTIFDLPKHCSGGFKKLNRLSLDGRISCGKPQVWMVKCLEEKDCAIDWCRRVWLASGLKALRISILQWWSQMTLNFTMMIRMSRLSLPFFNFLMFLIQPKAVLDFHSLVALISKLGTKGNPWEPQIPWFRSAHFPRSMALWGQFIGCPSKDPELFRSSKMPSAVLTSSSRLA